MQPTRQSRQMIGVKHTISRLILLCILTLLNCTAIALPNIVFILADDMGVGDVSCLNPEGKIPTSNIDRLAEEGMTFKFTR